MTPFSFCSPVKFWHLSQAFCGPLSFSHSGTFWYLSCASFRSFSLCFWEYLFTIFIYRKKHSWKNIFIFFFIYILHLIFLHQILLHQNFLHWKFFFIRIFFIWILKRNFYVVSNILRHFFFFNILLQTHGDNNFYLL